MRKLLQTNTLILLFYFLLLLSLLFLLDYYIFWIMQDYISSEYLLLGMALLSGIFSLMILNSIIDTTKEIQSKILQGQLLYLRFTSLIITIGLGIPLVLPGLASSGLALICYIPPVRKFISMIVYKFAKQKIIAMFSLFLYEHMEKERTKKIKP